MELSVQSERCKLAQDTSVICLLPLTSSKKKNDV